MNDNRFQTNKIRLIDLTCKHHANRQALTWEEKVRRLENLRKDAVKLRQWRRPAG